MRNKKYNLLELQKIRESWEDVRKEFIPDVYWEIYKNRKLAVDLYIDNASYVEIYNKTGIRHNKLADLIRRCLNNNPETGLLYGYTALVPHKKTVSSSPHFPSPDVTLDANKRGAFKRLLLLHPSLEHFIESNYLCGDRAIIDKNVSPSNLHKRFLEECKRLNIQDYEYPFNTADKARRTFYTYLKQLEKENCTLAMVRQGKNVRQKFASTGQGIRLRPSPLTPFSTVQIDGHKIDMLYTVEVLNKHGEIQRMPAMRMWLIAVIDVATRTIIGYSLTSNENYNQTDILRAIRNSIIPRTPIDFTLPGLQYPDNGGFPSVAIPETKWAVPNIIMLDNAKSHLADNVIEKLCSQLFCSLNYGSVATPETRGIVERMFGTLERGGYHRLASTTGSNIQDPRREGAEKDAVKYQITFNDIAQLTEYFIAMYNTSAHSALDNQTPLECMRRRIQDAGMQPCVANDTLKQKIYELTNVTEIKTVRGSVKHGKRPYITYKGVEYRNDILSQSMGLIGEELIVDINPDDVSTIRAYFKDGTELGILTATGEWGRRAHSLKTREEALKLANRNKQKNNPFYAPLTELENELNERAARERRARTKAARMRVEQGVELMPENPVLRGNIVQLSSAQRFQETSDDEAKRKKKDSYTPDEIEAIINAGSIQEAYEKGLF